MESDSQSSNTNAQEKSAEVHTQKQDLNHQQQDSNQNQDSGSSQNTGMAIVGTIPILFFVPLLTDAKDDELVKFHSKQGLVLLLYGIITQVANFVLVFIPILGWLAMLVLWIFGLICLIMGIINAAQGKKKELPIIGKFGHKFDF